MSGVSVGRRAPEDRDLTTSQPPALSPEGLSPERLTAILTAGRPGSGRISSIASSPVGQGIGLIAILRRLTLEWEDEPGGPASVVVKASAAAGASRATGVALQMYARESAFYAGLGGGAAWQAPTCFSAEFDAATHDHLIVMEDLGAGRFADSVTGVSPDDARLVLSALADVHARAWGAGPELAPFPRVDDPGLVGIWSGQYPAWWEVAVAGVCRDFRASTKAVFASLPGHLEALAGFLAAGTLTIGHGDVRGDNVVFGLADRPAVLFDWQFVDVCRPGRDVGYFLTQSMQPADRRAHTDELIDVYLARLRSHGVALDRETLMLEVRAGALLSTTYGVGAIGAVDHAHKRAAAVAAAQTSRSASAIEDLDLPGVLSEI